MSFIKYIADERSAQRDACPSKNHYKEVLSLVAKAKRTVWIGTYAKIYDGEWIELPKGRKKGWLIPPIVI